MKGNLAEQLLEKYIEGNCTSDECMLVELWYESLAANRPEAVGGAKDRISAKMKRHIDRSTGYHSSNYRLLKRFAVAASIILVLGTAIYFLKPVPRMSAELNAFAGKVQPGGRKAYLTLANGKRLLLNDLAIGLIANETGNQIHKTADGQLIYEACETCHPSEGVIAEGFNTIETPRGGQYQVHLPDGTRVWLNAGSVFKYPVNFAESNRSVELSGEAYFEVAKDRKRPFLVKNQLQQVEVIGTHFNVNSYPNELSVKTTLLEGVVKIVNLSSPNRLTGDEVIIKPGEQSVLSNHKLRVSKVDPEDAIGWKQGLFVFDEDPLVEVMNKISRWYDVDISFKDPSLGATRFSGSISRNLTLNKALDKLGLTGGLKFDLVQRTIIVSER